MSVARDTKTIKRTLDEVFAAIAIDTSHLSRPVTREEVVRRLGEEAALAWDDIRAARQSYWKAVRALATKEQT